MLWDDEALYVRFDVQDRREELVARWRQPNSPCYTDSCVEIFLAAGGSSYINVECSAAGAILLQMHPTPRKGDSVDPARWRSQVDSWTSVDAAALKDDDPPGPYAWALALRLPFVLLGDLLGVAPLEGRPGRSGWRVGLFKCADDSPHPHWGSWVALDEQLDFHQHQLFGELFLTHSYEGQGGPKDAELDACLRELEAART